MFPLPGKGGASRASTSPTPQASGELSEVSESATRGEISTAKGPSETFG